MRTGRRLKFVLSFPTYKADLMTQAPELSKMACVRAANTSAASLYSALAPETCPSVPRIFELLGT